MKRIFIGLLVLLAAAVAALTWLVVIYPTQRPEPKPSKTVTIQLAPTASLDAVASQLHARGLIGQPSLFALYARVMGAGPRLKQGQVLVTSQMTIRQLLQRIATGYGSTPLLITIPEGFNRFDVAQRLGEWGVCDAAAFLAADAQPTTAEGYLFPDTYWLQDGMPAAQVLKKLTDNAQRRMAPVFEGETEALARLSQELGFGQREVVILASIVEKEAHVPSEQPLIAGVFLNRLRDSRFKPKRLQADPTVAYGCNVRRELASCAGFDGKRVTRNMTADPENPYNTYRIEGLPPSPIANPGLSALRAVLHPAEHGFFYFVARRDGHHSFSASLSEHNLAVHGDPTSAAR
jgi:UPF0755 protein